MISKSSFPPTPTQVGASHQRKVRYESRSVPQSEPRSRGASFPLIELLVVTCPQRLARLDVHGRQVAILP